MNRLLLFFTHLPGLSNNLSQSLVLHDTRCVYQWVDLGWIGFFISQTIFIDIGFSDFTDQQCMAAEIQGMNYLALKIYRAFLNQGGGIEFAVIDLKNLRFVDFMTGIDTAIINFFNQICRRYINGKRFVG